MHLQLGFSTCPNDTFIFDAIVHQRVDTEGLEFDIHLADVEELNRAAFANSIDVTKMSYAAYMHVADNYQLLNAGSALGNGNGPLLISKRPIDSIQNLTIAIPGSYTTANLLLNIAYPNLNICKEYLFSDIEDAVLNDEVDAGVIIHENRFTYHEKGLIKLMDLGQYWETNYHQPIPLGGIAIKRSLPLEIRQKVSRVLRRSVEFAMNNPEISLDFVRQHAQEMQEEIMYKHIALYVNHFTVDLGENGKKAIEMLYTTAFEKGMISRLAKDFFVE